MASPSLKKNTQKKQYNCLRWKLQDWAQKQSIITAFKSKEYAGHMSWHPISPTTTHHLLCLPAWKLSANPIMSVINEKNTSNMNTY